MLYKIFMKNVQILIQTTTCKKWSTGTLEKYWKPCTSPCYTVLELCHCNIQGFQNVLNLHHDSSRKKLWKILNGTNRLLTTTSGSEVSILIHWAKELHVHFVLPWCDWLRRLLYNIISLTELSTCCVWCTRCKPLLVFKMVLLCDDS